MKKLYITKPGKYPEDEITNNEDRFYGVGWLVEKIGGKYFLEYMSGAQGSKENRIEIKKEDYNQAKNGEINLDVLCIRYNVY